MQEAVTALSKTEWDAAVHKEYVFLVDEVARLLFMMSQKGGAAMPEQAAHFAACVMYSAKDMTFEMLH